MRKFVTGVILCQNTLCGLRRCQDRRRSPQPPDRRAPLRRGRSGGFSLCRRQFFKKEGGEAEDQKKGWGGGGHLRTNILNHLRVCRRCVAYLPFCPRTHRQDKPAPRSPYQLAFVENGVFFFGLETATLLTKRLRRRSQQQPQTTNQPIEAWFSGFGLSGRRHAKEPGSRG